MLHDKINHLIKVDASFVQGIDLSKIPHTPIQNNGKSEIVLKDDFTTCRYLAQFGRYLPGPITWDYDWPTYFEGPFSHQITTANFLTFHHKAFNLNDIGTGKTLATLWALDYLQRRGEMGRVLICGTLSTLETVWERDILMHFPGKKCTVLHGYNKDKRLWGLNQNVPVYIINHDGLKVMIDDIIARKDITHLIIDESSEFRNSGTDKYKVMKKVAEDKSIWLISGAPMPTAPTDIWAQARLINPHLLPQYFTRFRDLVMYKVGDYTWKPRPKWEQYIYNTIRPAIRFKRDQCIDLPPCTYTERICDMTAEQLKLYNDLKKECIAEYKGGTFTAVNEGVKIVKLLQIATGAIYDTDRNIYNLDCKPKLALLDETIIESGCKCIVATPFKHSTKLLKDHISRNFSVDVVNGDVSLRRRAEIFHNFQHGDLQVMLVHPKVMAHGLNFTNSFLIAWWGPIDNFDLYDQANGRITRPGQQNKQIIRHLICSPIERKIYNRLATHEKLQGLLLEMFCR